MSDACAASDGIPSIRDMRQLTLSSTALRLSGDGGDGSGSLDTCSWDSAASFPFVSSLKGTSSHRTKVSARSSLLCRFVFFLAMTRAVLWVLELLFHLCSSNLHGAPTMFLVPSSLLSMSIVFSEQQHLLSRCDSWPPLLATLSTAVSSSSFSSSSSPSTSSSPSSLSSSSVSHSASAGCRSGELRNSNSSEYLNEHHCQNERQTDCSHSQHCHHHHHHHQHQHQQQEQGQPTDGHRRPHHVDPAKTSAPISTATATPPTTASTTPEPASTPATTSEKTDKTPPSLSLSPSQLQALHTFCVSMLVALALQVSRKLPFPVKASPERARSMRNVATATRIAKGGALSTAKAVSPIGSGRSASLALAAAGDAPGIDDWVSITNSAHDTVGKIRYAGETQFSQGEWLGIECLTAIGKCDGSINGVRYFTCPTNHGLFTRPNLVKKVAPPAGAESLAPTPLAPPPGSGGKHHRLSGTTGTKSTRASTLAMQAERSNPHAMPKQQAVKLSAEALVAMELLEQGLAQRDSALVAEHLREACQHSVPSSELRSAVEFVEESLKTLSSSLRGAEEKAERSAATDHSELFSEFRLASELKLQAVRLEAQSSELAVELTSERATATAEMTALREEIAARNSELLLSSGALAVAAAAAAAEARTSLRVDGESKITSGQGLEPEALTKNSSAVDVEKEAQFAEKRQGGELEGHLEHQEVQISKTDDHGSSSGHSKAAVVATSSPLEGAGNANQTVPDVVSNPAVAEAVVEASSADHPSKTSAARQEGKNHSVGDEDADAALVAALITRADTSNNDDNNNNNNSNNNQASKTSSENHRRSEVEVAATEGQNAAVATAHRGGPFSDSSDTAVLVQQLAEARQAAKAAEAEAQRAMGELAGQEKFLASIAFSELRSSLSSERTSGEFASSASSEHGSSATDYKLWRSELSIAKQQSDSLIQDLSRLVDAMQAGSKSSSNSKNSENIIAASAAASEEGVAAASSTAAAAAAAAVALQEANRLANEEAVRAVVRPYFEELNRALATVAAQQAPPATKPLLQVQGGSGGQRRSFRGSFAGLQANGSAAVASSSSRSPPLCISVSPPVSSTAVPRQVPCSRRGSAASTMSAAVTRPRKSKRGSIGVRPVSLRDFVWMDQVKVPDRYLSRKGHIPDTHRRAITLQQLNELGNLVQQVLGAVHIIDPNPLYSVGKITWSNVSLYHINDLFVMQLTKTDQCSFVDLIAAEAQDPRWFISHWWGTPFFDSLTMLNFHAETRNISMVTPYWMCTFANNQWNLEEINTSDLLQTPFVKAIMSPTCEGTIMLMNRNAEPFRRTWCTLENFITTTHARQGKSPPQLLDVGAVIPEGVQVLQQMVRGGQEVEPQEVPRSAAMLMDDGTGFLSERVAVEGAFFPHGVAREGVNVNIATANASNEEDKKNILRLIIGVTDPQAMPEVPDNHPKYEEVNKAIHKVFAFKALYDAAMDGEVDRATRLLGLTTPDVRSVTNETQPLWTASYYNHQQVVQLLLTARADPLLARADGNTPAHAASATNSVEVLELLLAQRADVNAAARDGATPVLMAAQDNSTDALEVLLDARADPDVANRDGVTALSLAAGAGNEEDLQLLLHARANPNKVNAEGRTPVLEAAGHGQSEVLTLLLKASGDPNLVDTEGATALSWATYLSDLASVKSLLEAKADVNHESMGETALDGAYAARDRLLDEQADQEEMEQNNELIKVLEEAGAKRLGQLKQESKAQQQSVPKARAKLAQAKNRSKPADASKG